MRETKSKAKSIKNQQLGIMSLAALVLFGGAIYSGQVQAKPKVKMVKNVEVEASSGAVKAVTPEVKTVAKEAEKSTSATSYWPSNKVATESSAPKAAVASNNTGSNLVSNTSASLTSNVSAAAASAQPRVDVKAMALGAAGASAIGDSGKYDPCAGILKTKNQACTGLECADKQKMLDVSYQICSGAEEDTMKTKRPGSLEEKRFQTSTGFSYAFKNVEISLTNTGLDYNKTKTEYNNLKAQYQPIKRKNNEYLGMGKYMDQATYQNLMGQEKKIEESITKLDLILASNSNYDQFKASYKKFVPDILLDKPEYDKKYRNQTFTKIECEFLNLTFRTDVISQLQKKYSYSCAA